MGNETVSTLHDVFLQTPGNDLRLASVASSVRIMAQRFDAALKGIREEFDDHLEAINESTDEIEANHEMLCRLESRVDTIEAQLERLQLTLSRYTGQEVRLCAEQSIELDEREKEVFLILYTAPEDKPVTYREVAAALKESELLVRGYITNMIEKGVPVAKRYISGTAYLALDRSFRSRQAKENIVRLSQRTVTEF